MAAKLLTRGYTVARLSLLTISAFFTVFLLFLIINRAFLLLEADAADSASFVGADFSYFYAAGQLVEQGHVDQLYDVEAYNKMVAEVRTVDALPKIAPWSYPPTILPFMASLALFDFETAWMLWSLFSVITFALLARAGSPNWWVPSLALLSPFFLLTLMIGQVGILLAVLTIGGLLLYRAGHKVSAGLVWGLLIIKPHLAVGLPLLVLRDRQWPTALAAGASLLSLVAISWVIWPDAWVFLWASLGSNLQQVLVAGDERLTIMATFYSLFTYLGMPSVYAMTLHALLASVAIGLGVKILMTHNSIIHQLAVLLVLPAMISPYLFHNDLAGIAFLVGIVGMKFGGRKYTGTGSIIWLLLLLLTVLIMLDTFFSLHLCTPFFLVLLWVIYRHQDDSVAVDEPLQSLKGG